MGLADIGCGARHPERPVLHLLAQLDQEGVVVAKFEAAAIELADERGGFESRFEAGPNYRQPPHHCGDLSLVFVNRPQGGHQSFSTASSIMNPTIALPLSGTMHRTLSPACSRPERTSLSSMIQIEAEPTFPLSAKVVNQRSCG